VSLASIHAADGPVPAVIAAGHRLVEAKGAAFTTHELVEEAGVALQTFYKYFGSKDKLLVALIADQIREHCERLRAGARGIADPVERLRLHIRTTLTPLRSEGEIARAKFIASEHWRLHPLVPELLTSATQPFTDLIRFELEAAAAQGSLRPRHPPLDAWLITRTVMSVFHHCVYLANDPVVATITNDVAAFCVAAVRGEPGAESTLADGMTLMS
jgi:TetR/AcrR family transcriptional regulator